MNNINNQYYQSFTQTLSSICNSSRSPALSCICLNIRSLRKNFNSLLVATKDLLGKVDFILLVETNITDSESKLYGIPGYNFEFINRNKKQGGGIGVYIRQNIAYDVHIPRVDTFESIIINVKHNTIDLSILCMYRPPGLTSGIIFRDDLSEVINNKCHSSLFVLGDANLDLFSNKTETTLYLDMLSTIGLISCNSTLPTRVDLTRGTSTNIDHVLARAKKGKISTGVINCNISDHYALFLSYESEKYRSDNYKKRILLINEGKVFKSIQSTNWNECCLQIQNNDTYTTFQNKFQQIYKNSLYLKKIEKARNPVPWITNELLNYCNERDKLYKIWKRKPSLKSRENFRQLRNKVNKILYAAKSRYYREKFLECANDIHKTWKVINELTGKPSRNADDAILKNFKGEPKSIADNFGQSFSTNVSKILHKCSIKFANISTTHQKNSMFLEKASEIEIFNILNNFKINKSAGIDDIRAKDLKMNASIFAPVITKIVNEIIEKQQLPDTLKIALIKPIHKSSSKSVYDNYRPISILPSTEKIFEQVLYKRLYEYVEKNNIISNNQYGFRAGWSINKLLGNFANCLNENKSKAMHSLVLFIDFSKAFDTLSHHKILSKLHDIGVRGCCYNLFKNYLHERYYQVKIGNSFSEKFNSKTGVPQGSKLGPLLYIIYANGLLKVLENYKVFAYADDTAVIIAHKDPKKAEEEMQNVLNAITEWCHDNDLIINANKTKLMHFQPHNPKPVLINIMHKPLICSSSSPNTKIEVVKTLKYLGIIIDDRLKWSPHVEYVRKKLRSAMYAFYQLQNICNRRTLKQIYHAIAESHLRFGITAWGSASCCKRLYKIQEKLAKHLINKKEAGTNEVLNVDNIYKYTMVMTYGNRREFRVEIDHIHNTRNKTNGKFKIRRYFNNFGKYTLPSIIPKLLNELPSSILKTVTKWQRKNMLKNFYMSTQQLQP